MTGLPDPDDQLLPTQHIVITIDIEAGPGGHRTALCAVGDIIGRLGYDGIEPTRSAMEITTTATTT